MLTIALAILLSAQDEQSERPRVQCGATFEIQETESGSIGRCPADVVVTYQDIRLEADWAEYNIEKRTVTAGNRVRFTRGEEFLEGEKLNYDFGNKTGTFTNVKGELEPGFFVTFEEGELRADGTWQGKGVTATSCKEECPNWMTSFGSAVVDPGNKVTGTNFLLRAKGLPVLWVPKMVIPTATKDRSSGFLIPSTSVSDTKGRGIREDFYWAINRSADATLGAEYFSKRGPAGHINFRAVPSAATTLDVDTFFVIDRLDQGGQRTRVRTDSTFGDGWRGVAELDFTSAFLFRQIFEEGFNQISSPIEHSQGFMSRNRPRSSLNVQYDRTAIFFPEQPTIVLRKFPSANYAMPLHTLARGPVPVYFSFEGGYSGVARRDDRIDAPSVMQRFDVHPAIDVPLIRTRALQWSHRLTLRNTLYTHSLRTDIEQNALNRASFDYTTELTGAQLERSFGSWRHIIEPGIKYRYVAGIDRYHETIVVDEADLVTNTNEVEYSITNRFVAGHEFLTWRVAQKLYFEPEFGGALLAGRRNSLAPLMNLTGFAFSDGTPRRFSPIVSTIRVATSPQTATDIQIDYDTQSEQIRSAGVTGQLNRGQWLSSMAYFLNRESAIQSFNNQLRGMIRYGSQDKRGISFGFSFYSDLSRSLLQGSTAQISYNADCYGISFNFSQYDVGARKETGFRFSLSLKNLGSFGTLQPQERLF